MITIKEHCFNTTNPTDCCFCLVIETKEGDIHFVFGPSVTEDHLSYYPGFSAGNSLLSLDNEINRIKEKVSSCPIIEKILQNALEDEQVKESLNKNEITQYRIKSDRLEGKDYRNPDCIYRKKNDLQL